MISVEEKPIIVFVTYTKGTEQFVTTPYYESQFLDWLNKDGRSSTGFARAAYSSVGIRCCPMVVHQTEKKEATILQLVKNDE